MDIQNKCCGNCKHFKNEDVEGWGVCDKFVTQQHKGESECTWYVTNSNAIIKRSNGWTEITPDNSDDLYKKDEDRIIIAYCHNGEVSYERYVDSQYIPSEMAELGGYYYYVLPELKIAHEKD